LSPALRLRQNEIRLFSVPKPMSHSRSFQSCSTVYPQGSSRVSRQSPSAAPRCGIATLTCLVLGAGLTLQAPDVTAQAAAPGAWPAKPLRWIIPWPPGGGADVIGRLSAQRLSDALGQTIVVENRAGASGQIGTEAAARSAPDGYTLFQGNTTTLSINPGMFAKLPYDPIRDFAPVSLINLAPMIVIVHPSLPVQSIGDLVALAKKRPGQLNYASAGLGSSSHLAAEMFRARTGTDLVHVPYKGAAPAMSDLLTGQVPVMFSDVITPLPHIRSGKLRAITVLGRNRIAQLPEVQTVAEQRGPGDLEVGSWTGLLVPAGTPREIVMRLNSELARIGASRDFRERLIQSGGGPVHTSPEEFSAFLKADLARFTRAIKDSGAKVE
jgi:tripartite-type tricarboxylate transporter receptor subunit TctC